MEIKAHINKGIWRDVMSRNANEVIKDLEDRQLDHILKNVYIDGNMVNVQRERYIKAVKEFIKLFGNKEIEIYSAPGRSEIGGNHTDHQYGKVLAASVNIDAIAVVTPTTDDMIHIKSEGYKRLDIDLTNLSVNPLESGSTTSLIRGRFL